MSIEEGFYLCSSLLLLSELGAHAGSFSGQVCLGSSGQVFSGHHLILILRVGSRDHHYQILNLRSYSKEVELDQWDVSESAFQGWVKSGLTH